MTKALVLLSGGLDSATTLGLAVREFGVENVGAISMIYPSKHNHVEIQSAGRVAQHYGLRDRFVRDVSSVFQGAKSTLIETDRELPDATYRELYQAEGPSSTYVPLRNPVFISVAASTALIQGYDELWVGVHLGDFRGAAYPDCDPDVIGSLGAALYIGSYMKLRLRAPLQYDLKSDVVRKGHAIDVPFELTRTCYTGSQYSACQNCPSCRERIWAFRENGLVDPVKYDGPHIDWSIKEDVRSTN